MKILIDLQGCQTDGSRARGIGRYSFQVIRHLVNLYPEHQFILFANPHLFDLREELSIELLNNQNVFYFQWFSPGPLKNVSNYVYSHNWFARKLREYAIASLSADVILITSFFEGFNDNAIVDISHDENMPPYAVIFYDLIPLINKKEYLDTNPVYKIFYKEKIKEIKKASGFLAISSSTAKEVRDYLNIDEKKVFNIASGCDKKLFSPVSTKYNFERQVNVHVDRYILYSGAADSRKNINRLITAYSKLSPKLILEYKLVLAGKLLPIERISIQKCILENGLSEEHVIILGFVTDSELVSLYSNCSLFVFPSLHEGFGLPVLEAMSCGAPVIGSSITSIPEIIGDDTALFDPFDVYSIVHLIEKSLINLEFREKLISNSRQQSKKFSWESTAASIIQALKYIVDNENKTSNKDSIFNRNVKRDNLLVLFNKALVGSRSESKNKELKKQLSSAIVLIDEQISDFSRTQYADIDNLQWQIEGPFDSTYSLAILNRSFCRGLAANKIDVSILSAEGAGEFTPSKSFLNSNVDLMNFNKRCLDKDFQPQIISRNLYPPRVCDLNSTIRMLHCYGWEESSFPEHLVDDFNMHLSGITVMSEYVKKTLIDNGVYIPIQVTGLGIDHILNIDQESNLDIDKKGFSFLHVSSCFPRKGIEKLIEAYCSSFKSEDDVTLIIKTFPNPHNNIKEFLGNLSNKFINIPQILLIEEEYTVNQMIALYKLSNVLVAPSFGEGFGLPIGEAMLQGLPVITTAFGAQLDFCSSENSWLLDYNYQYSRSHFGLSYSTWVEPSISELSSIMLYLFNSKSKEISNRTSLARKSVKRFNWDQVAKNNIKFIEKLISLKAYKKPRIGWISTWNTRCGIASYSKYLTNSITDYKLILAPFIDNQSDLDESFVRRCWHNSSEEPNSFDNLLKIVLDSKITTIVIQFNFSFYNYNDLEILLNQLFEHKIKVFVFFHSTQPPANTSQYDLKIISKSLSKCDRLLVHTPKDLNNLKHIGLDKNAAIFPHGMIDYNYKKDKTSKLSQLFTKNIFFNSTKILNLSTYGFLLPNKGFIELIEAISMLKDINFDVTLTMVTSKYFENDNFLLNQINDRINKLDLNNYIEIHSDYKSDEDSLKLLSHSDLIVLPYQNSNESSSASVRHAIASGTPVAVTPQNIFDDVNPMIFRLPGFTPKSIMDGIIEYFELINTQRISTELSELKKNWISQHNFTRLSRRIQGMIRAIENQ